MLLAPAAAFAQAGLANTTQMSYSPGHGTQVEYMAADGSTWLWYPGNKSILPGQWKVSGGQLCFRYGGNSFNPVTGHRGGGWECGSLQTYQSTRVDMLNGDALRLKGRGKVPFQLSKSRTSFENIVRKMRRSSR